jgi:predicted dehydrogenase
LNLVAKTSSDSPDVGLPSSPVSESPYTTQIKEFYSVLLGEKQPRIEAEDGMAAVQIAEAAIQSAATGKAVTLELLTEVLS